MKRTELKQIASILPADDPESTAYKLSALLRIPHQPISGKTAAIESECPLFGGNGPIEQNGLFAESEPEQ